MSGPGSGPGSPGSGGPGGGGPGSPGGGGGPGSGPGSPGGDTLIGAAEMSGRERYQLLTSLVVPRPIAWISSRSADGRPNLAPFSYYMGVAASPMLVAVSIGTRRGEPKDSLRNLREHGDFCINVVTEDHLAAMNATAGEYHASVDEFAVAGLELADAAAVDAPYVADCPAVLECRLFRELDLGDVPNVLVVAEIVLVRLSDRLEFLPGTRNVDPAGLRPVGRLGGELYTLLGEMPALARPRVDTGE